MVNQKHLVSKIREKLKNRKYKIDDIDAILNAMTEIILDSTSHGEDVNINKLGKFYSRFIKGKTLTSNILWLQGKEYKTNDKYKLGFRPAKKANEEVKKLSTKISDLDKSDA